jgi:PiT family inorganic phosphate transporter
MYLVLFFVVLALAYANGANDNIKPFATVYGSRLLGYGQTLALASGSQLAGSTVSIVVAGALMKSFGGKGFVPDDLVGSVDFLVAVGIGASVAVGLATRLGIPISTTHALVGGLAGSGLAIAPNAVSWAALAAVFFLPLAASPAAAMILVAVLYPIITAIRRQFGVEPTTQLVRAARYEMAAANPDGTAEAKEAGYTYALRGGNFGSYEGTVLGLSAGRIVDLLHLGSAGALGFARGLNDTPKILGILLAAKFVGGLNTHTALAFVAVAMVIGGIVHSRKLARTLGQKITSISRGQGLLANAVSSSFVILASFAGMPVSTTHVSSGAIFGLGLWTGEADWGVVRTILLAWFATLPVAALSAYVTFLLLTIG